MKSGQMDMAYRDIKRFIDVRKPRTMIMENKDGKSIYDDIMIVKWLKEYLEHLYSGYISNLTIEKEEDVAFKDIDLLWKKSL